MPSEASSLMLPVIALCAIWSLPSAVKVPVT